MRGWLSPEGPKLVRAPDRNEMGLEGKQNARGTEVTGHGAVVCVKGVMGPVLSLPIVFPVNRTKTS